MMLLTAGALAQTAGESWAAVRTLAAGACSCRRPAVRRLLRLAASFVREGRARLLAAARQAVSVATGGLAVLVLDLSMTA